jgi:hypothetical protein
LVRRLPDHEFVRRSLVRGGHRNTGWRPPTCES